MLQAQTGNSDSSTQRRGDGTQADDW